MPEYIDEEGLLKLINIFELSREITKLNWGWDDHSNPINKAHDLLVKGQKLFLEISEYKQRMGLKIGTRQRKDIEDGIEGMGKIISYLQDKIKPYELTINNNSFLK
jgi:hypothetical protein